MFDSSLNVETVIGARDIDGDAKCQFDLTLYLERDTDWNIWVMANIKAPNVGSTSQGHGLGDSDSFGHYFGT